MSYKIWDSDLASIYQGYFLLAVCLIVILLSVVKNTKQHELGHLVGGVLLIFCGGTIWLLMSSGAALIDVLHEAKRIGFESASVATRYLEMMRLLLPTISVAFGTRFVGNWVTSEKPVKTSKDE
jgi:hypothetical protein